MAKDKKKKGGRFGARSDLSITYDELIGFCARYSDAANFAVRSVDGLTSIDGIALALRKSRTFSDLAAYASFAAVEILGVGEDDVVGDIESAMETR